jgi:hypothetical protein
VNSLPFEDRGDFEDAGRGLVGSLDPGVVKDASGRVVWDNDAFAFLREDCPETSVRGSLSSATGGLLRLFAACALAWVVLATGGAGRRGGPQAGLAAGMVKCRAEAMVSRGAVRGARDPGLLALRSASGLGPPEWCAGGACPDSAQPSW